MTVVFMVDRVFLPGCQTKTIFYTLLGLAQGLSTERPGGPATELDGWCSQARSGQAQRTAHNTRHV
jgi:hypothetical protein